MRIALLVFGLLGVVSPPLFAEQNCQGLNKLHWLLGAWQSETSKAQENWQQVSVNSFEGQGLVPGKSSRPVQQESLALLQMSGELFYLAKVKHNALPVAFTVAECKAGYFRAENVQHDFPQWLEYRLLAPEQLQVRVGAKSSGFTVTYVRSHDE